MVIPLHPLTLLRPVTPLRPVTHRVIRPQLSNDEFALPGANEKLLREMDRKERITNATDLSRVG